MAEVAGGLRRRVATGTLINAAFLAFVNGLSLIRGFVVAAFLTSTEYGTWGVLAVILVSVLWLKSAGIGDKFVQQEDEDQEAAFQYALTLDLCLSIFALICGLVILPVLALLLGHPEIIAPGAVLLLLLPATTLQAPIWVFYRRFEFGKQRLLSSVEPVVALAVTVALAASGAGVWSLVLGTVAGSFGGGVAALVACPYRVALRFDREVARSYWSFSWPVFVGKSDGVVVGQALVFAGEAKVGLAGLGVITLASTITQFIGRADQAVSQALYPAICRVRDRRHLFLEAFQTSNRLSLMWGFPFGMGVMLFGPDLLRQLGPEWTPGAVLLSAVGASVAVHQIGFNWGGFYKATGNTKVLAPVALIQAGLFVVVAVPLLLAAGLDGLAIGFLLIELASLAMRWTLLRRLLPELRFVRHMARSVLPSLLPIGLVVAMRFAESGPRETWMVAAEVALYLVVTAAGTLVLERSLLRDVLRLFGRTPVPQTAG